MPLFSIFSLLCFQRRLAGVCYSWPLSAHYTCRELSQRNGATILPQFLALNSHCSIIWAFQDIPEVSRACFLMKMTPSVFAVDLAIPATYLLGLCLQMLSKTRDTYDLKRGAEAPLQWAFQEGTARSEKSCPGFLYQQHIENRHLSVSSSSCFQLFLYGTKAVKTNRLTVSQFSLCTFSGQVIHIQLLRCDQWWRFYRPSTSRIFVSKTTPLLPHPPTPTLTQDRYSSAPVAVWPKVLSPLADS